MPKTLKLLLALSILVATSGCGPDQAADERSQAPADEQQALRESAFGSMVETMDRAREVESLQMERKDTLDAAIEQSDQP